MKAKLVTHCKTHIACPNCGCDEGFSVDHLPAKTSFGPWYCETCGHSIVGHKLHDGTVDIDIRTERKITTLDVLVLKPQTLPVYFVVEGMRFEGGRDSSSGDVDDSKQFFYESHSCPTNWLKPVLMYFDGYNDPHGVIEYVSYRDESNLPPDENFGPNDRDAALTELIEADTVKS